MDYINCHKLLNVNDDLLEEKLAAVLVLAALVSSNEHFRLTCTTDVAPVP